MAFCLEWNCGEIVNNLVYSSFLKSLANLRKIHESKLHHMFLSFSGICSCSNHVQNNNSHVQNNNSCD